MIVVEMNRSQDINKHVSLVQHMLHDAPSFPIHLSIEVSFVCRALTVPLSARQNTFCVSAKGKKGLSLKVIPHGPARRFSFNALLF